MIARALARFRSRFHEGLRFAVTLRIPRSARAVVTGEFALAVLATALR